MTRDELETLLSKLEIDVSNNRSSIRLALAKAAIAGGMHVNSFKPDIREPQIVMMKLKDAIRIMNITIRDVRCLIDNNSIS